MSKPYRDQYRFTGDADYLIHYGVSGQQWGKRRYQNEDGTLTEEGRRRYLKNADQHSRDVYNHMTEDGKRIVDGYMASGKNLKESIESAVRDTANQVRKEEYNRTMVRRATSFLSGYGATLLGTIAVSRNHPMLGAILRGTGRGVMIGNAIGAFVDTAINANAKDMISNTKISDIEIVDKKKSIRSTQDGAPPKRVKDEYRRRGSYPPGTKF